MLLCQLECAAALLQVAPGDDNAVQAPSVGALTCKG